MRPAGRHPLESLYFEYPRFAAPRCAELDGRSTRHKVVITGAGPIGMTAALTLASHGIASVLLERKNTFNDGSRAICIARASMHILERIGAVEPFLAKALGWRYGRSYYRDRQVYRLEMPHSDDEKYLPMYNLQQQYIEQYLHDAVAREPLIDMRWESEVTGIAQDGEGATLAIATPLGGYDLAADYVLAADGARSPLRRMLGLSLKGENYEGRYVIADVRMAHDFPTERRAFFEPAGNPGGTVLIHKQPDDIWRIDYQLREGESEADAIKEANLRARIQAILAGIGHTGAWDLEWWSIYAANTLCLDDYRHGRVFFIGDSAHIVPIFGVRGLNNGLADAHNIGWKLAMVVAGTARPRLLESYSPERRAATLDVFANAGKSTRFMTPPTRGWRLAREAALSLSLSEEFPRGLADPRQMQPATYASSPLTAPGAEAARFTAGPAGGAAAMNARLDDGGYLLDHLGPGFSRLSFGTGAATAAEARLEQRLGALAPGFRLIRIAPHGTPRAGAGLEDRDGRIAAMYGAGGGGVYLVRPDMHIAGRWLAIDGDRIEQAMRTCLGRDRR